MIASLVYRTLRSTRFRCVWKFTWNFGVMGILAMRRHRRRLRRGVFFPPFLYISITNACNLRCQGCWVDVSGTRVEINLEDLNRTINGAKKQGNRFFGILGGEPFMLSDQKMQAINSLNVLANADLKKLLRRVAGRIFNEIEFTGWCSEQKRINAQNTVKKTAAPTPAP